MTITDNINFWCTVVSIVVTLLSIGFSIWSFFSAKKAKQYKEETLLFKDTFELRSLLDQFILESRQYQNQTRELDWYKGRDVNAVINPFNSVLLSFGNLYHLMRNRNMIQSRVHKLQSLIQQYTQTTRILQREINTNILEIIELLQDDTQKRMKEVIKQ